MDKRSPDIGVEELNKELRDLLPASETGQSRPVRRRRRHNPEEDPASPRWVRICLIILCTLVILSLAAVGTVAYLIRKGEKEVSKNRSEEEIRLPDGAEMDGDVLVYKGERYRYNDRVVTMLCLGVDKPLAETSRDKIGQNGQADTLVLAVLNRKTNQLKFINISRETMTQVKVYNKEDGYTGMERMQICLAYAYGDGKDSSCLRTLQTVSSLMYGIPIHGYMTMDYDAISILNDAVGGVRVKVLEDLSSHDPALTKDAEITLKGDQAQTYVRSRNTNLLESNSLRMERQKQYMGEFTSMVRKKTRRNPTTPLSLLNKISGHLVTSIGPSQVTYLGSLAVRSRFIGGDILTAPGKVKDGGEYAEYIIDEKGLYDLILATFYDKLDEG